jgi:hypothetical protein
MGRTQVRSAGAARHPRHLAQRPPGRLRGPHVQQRPRLLARSTQGPSSRRATALGGVESEPGVRAQVQGRMGVGYAILAVLYDFNG